MMTADERPEKAGGGLPLAWRPSDEPPRRFGPMDVIGVVLIAAFLAMTLVQLAKDSPGRIARETMDALRTTRSH